MARVKKSIEIKVGDYSCILEDGLVVNPSLLTRWRPKEIREYIKFLEESLRILEVEGWG